MLENLADQISHFVNDILGPIATWMEGYVWGWPEKIPFIAAVLVGTGIYITIRLGLVQIRGFKHAIDITRGKFDDPNDAGDLNHFQALTTALSATVGIGNIAGVAIAIRWGGPGALFWMWVTAFFGMALKYTECTLAVKYRKVNPDGSISGGPMYYMEKGLGWKWVAVAFAIFAVVSSFGAGCMNQSNTLADQVSDQFGIAKIYPSIFFAIVVALVIIGGIKRIGAVTSILAPSMALLYVSGALIVLILNFDQIVPGLGLIVSQAFAPEPLVGGAAGSFFLTMMWGVRRGLFSNEAGQGSAPFAHAAAKTDEPVREGLVATMEPFIDTLVICTMTGLVIVMTGAYKDKVENTFPLSAIEAVAVESVEDSELGAARDVREAGRSIPLQVAAGELVGASFVSMNSRIENAKLIGASGSPWSGSLTLAPNGSVTPGDDSAQLTVVGESLLIGAPLTSWGFQKGLGGIGAWIVTIGVMLFAVSTGISWSYYGDRATEYLFGTRAVPVYRWMFIAFFFLGGILPLKAVWTFGDVFLGLMTFPNLLAILALSGVIAKATRVYFADPENFKPTK